MNKPETLRTAAVLGMVLLSLMLGGCMSAWEKAERDNKLESYLECLAKDAELSATFKRIKVSLSGLRKTDKPQPLDLLYGVGYDEDNDISTSKPKVQLGINTNRPPIPGHVFVIAAIRLQNLPRRRVQFPARLLYLSDDREQCWWGSFWLPAGGELRDGVKVTTDDKPLTPGDYIKRLPVLRWWRERVIDGAWAGTSLELGISGIKVCAPVAGDYVIIPALKTPAVTHLKKAEYVAPLVNDVPNELDGDSAHNIVAMLFEVPTNRLDSLALNYIEEPVASLRPTRP